MDNKMINLNDLALIQGVTVNKIYNILAVDDMLLGSIKYNNYDDKNPLIDEALVKGTDFYCETVSKEDKLKVKVMVKMFKESVEEVKVKRKIMKATYKALGYLRKSLEMIDPISERQVVEFVEHLFAMGLTDSDDIKLEIYNMLSQETEDDMVIEHYNNMLEEKRNMDMIRRMLESKIKNKAKISEDSSNVIEVDGVKIDTETGEVIEEQGVA